MRPYAFIRFSFKVEQATAKNSINGFDAKIGKRKVLKSRPLSYRICRTRGCKAAFCILYFDVDTVIRIEAAKRIHLVRATSVCRYSVSKITEHRIVLFDVANVTLKGVIESNTLCAKDQLMQSLPLGRLNLDP